MADKVGFIGLGIMGRPMAKNLMEAGYDPVLYNRTREKAEDLAAEGEAEVAESPREVAEKSDIIVTMLPDSPDVRNVVAGESGVLEGIREGSLVVDMSTISPVVTGELAEKVRERGASMLDAPVSGGDVGAIEGTLSIMVGGSEEDFERAKPLFEAMGKTVKDRKSTRLNSSHANISDALFCLEKKPRAIGRVSCGPANAAGTPSRACRSRGDLPSLALPPP